MLGTVADVDMLSMNNKGMSMQTCSVYRCGGSAGFSPVSRLTLCISTKSTLNAANYRGFTKDVNVYFNLILNDI